MILHYLDPRPIRRNLVRRKLWEPLLITIVLLHLVYEYKLEINTKFSSFFKTFDSVKTNTVLETNLCMPIDIEVENYQKLVELARKNKHPDCPIEDWVFIDKDGKLTYNTEYAEKNKLKINKCWVAAVRFKDDFKISIDKSELIEDGQYLNKSHEFFKISCVSSIKPRKWYHGFHARIFESKKVRKDPTKSPINVIFFGLDSVSREKWLNSLPVSSKYLTKTMGANILKGYNIVGDGTPAALIPILTGFHEEELPNTLKGTPNASFCDEVYPFVWKEFEEKLNYATMYNEDWPKVGMCLTII